MIRVKEKLHRELKIESAKNGVSLQEYLEEIIENR